MSYPVGLTNRYAVSVSRIVDGIEKPLLSTG